MKKSKGEETRERIVAAAEKLTLEKGYAGMSLDDVLKATSLTKGAFFHHFKNKAELARAVLERYAKNDADLFIEFAERADKLSDDPLERVIIFLRLFNEYLDGLGKPFPGCIFASYTYERHHFGEEVKRFIDESLDGWSALFEKKLQDLIDARPPKTDVTARSLAEMITTTIEGGFIMANAKNDATWTQRQSDGFQNYLRLLFAEN
ncbi:MAG: TetR/AcrR family transcriptional regulator [Hyphomicrobiaceae bacterium]